MPYAECHKAFGLEWRTTRYQHRAVPYAERHKAFGLEWGTTQTQSPTDFRHSA